MRSRRLLAAAGLLATIALLGALPTSVAQNAGPIIVSVTLNGTPASPEFVLAGRRFGARPEPSRPPADSPFCTNDTGGDLGLNFGDKLYFYDETADLEAGASGPDVIDCVGLIVKEFTETRVVFTLGSFYAGRFEVRDGDVMTFAVNGASLKLVVRYRQTVPNTQVCVVPRVVKLTLAKATSALKQARCTIGKVTKPKKPPKRALVVKSQRPAAQSAVPSGTKVAVTLG